ncbi:META domain-containing protein [Thiosulfativibrio zosterae]|uniref:META domain-containing protein n=1 Tax=Thiosulfativibrio zosterae TaxID=2675053 RepID=A0A6F8PQR6_9GAMM|nr:META domain-containing protein [Thiosulfativibrio zosterae]BBP44426.1 hypothetical protein THMIRHAT_21720 [Thiosulfativibrio zosterae]
MRLLTTILMGFLLGLGLMSCSLNSEKPVVQNVPLKGTTWHLTHQYDPKTFDAIGVDIQASLVLSDAGFSISGSDGCNRFVGAYQGAQSADGRLSFSRFSSTRMACIHHAEQSQAFMAALKGVTELELYGKILTLYQGNKPLLRFSPEAPAKQVQRVNYRCGTTDLKVHFEDQTAYLNWLDEEQILPYVLSASGTKYMNNQLTFWTKGRKAFLIWDKQNLACEQQD